MLCDFFFTYEMLPAQPFAMQRVSSFGMIYISEQPRII